MDFNAAIALIPALGGLIGVVVGTLVTHLLGPKIKWQIEKWWGLS
jgi:hypothetical protein